MVHKVMVFCVISGVLVWRNVAEVTKRLGSRSLTCKRCTSLTQVLSDPSIQTGDIGH